MRTVKVQSVWPGGEVELPEYRLAGDPVVAVSSPKSPLTPLCQRGGQEGEGLRAVVLGLAGAWERNWKGNNGEK